MANGIKFIFYPIVFLLLSCTLTAAALGPVVFPYLGMVDLLFLQSAPDFDREAADIYKEDDQPAEAQESQLQRSEIQFPEEGALFGKILIPSVEIDAPLIYGDDIKNMKKGVEVYSGTYLPGQGRTVLMGAHVTTHFRTLEQVQAGAEIEVRTNYGVYTYVVTGAQIARYDDTSAYDLTRREENLILYTCHRITGVGATPYRVFVYADYVSGPQIVS